ncbi:PaaX family transcriptional regulator C-terminal domain-containing protein [Ramlibacter sp.]|uniref:PaaX family transcriptional regulator C-terminal domain-containing protein n=1 Tax=Ramlibacter sp. TaxID=1917967 RepID=UPI002FC85887
MSPGARRLILNLLLGAGGAPLSARQAVASCALFGIRENSARVALARLASAGLIVAEGRGNYVLGPPAEALAADVAQWRQAEQRVGDWQGGWIAVHVAGLGRSDRKALRARERALGLLGLAELERGLYLRPDNLAQGAAGVRERLDKLGLGPDIAVFVARDFDAARERQARRLWDGAALNRRYRKTRQRLSEWLARSPGLEPEAAAREAFLLGHEAIRELVFDPLLPDPLVDVRARRAFTDTVIRFDAAGQALWQRFLAAA